MWSSLVKYVTCIIILLCFQEVFPQSFLNGSFELNSAGTNQANLENWQYNNIMAHSTAFGSYNGGGPNGGNMDIIGSWDYCGWGAQCGIWYVALTSGGTDAISLTLSSPLTAGGSYTLSFYDRSCIPLPAGSPVEIGVSNIADEFGTLIYAAPAPVYNGGWTHRAFSFIAPMNGLYITVRCGGANSGGPWTQIDNFTISSGCIGSVSLGNDTVLCQGDSLLLDASYPCANYLWHDGSLGSSFIVTQQGTYWVEITAGACVTRDTIQVDYLTPGSVNLGRDKSLCPGETALLNATVPGATYLWQDGSTNSIFLVTQAGTYHVTATIGACSSSDTVQISYKPAPSVNLGNDTALCNGNSLLLDTSFPGADYLWSDGQNNATNLVSQSRIYSVTVTAGGCSASDTISVSFLPQPNVNLGNDTSLCENASLSLSAFTPGASYLWQDGSTDSTITVFQSGSYHVTVSANGCESADTINVAVIPRPTVDLGPDTLLCREGTLTMDASSEGATYLWQDGSANPTFTIAQDGVYWVEITRDGCSARDTINVTFSLLETFNLGEDTTLCPGETLQLEVPISGATVNWQDGSSGSSFTVSESGIYWAEVLKDNCREADSIYVEHLDQIELDLGSDTALCEGNQLYLNAESPGAEYLWQDASSTSFFIAVNEGLYSVTVSNECTTLSDSIYLSILNCDCDIFFPKAFTPNNDGINDIFRARTECGIMNFEMKIFNRWGEMVFKTKNIQEGWSGTFRGKQAFPEVYVYVAWFTSESNANLTMRSGNITLIR